MGLTVAQPCLFAFRTGEKGGRMHLTKCIMAPTDSGSCNETVEVIVVAVVGEGG